MTSPISNISIKVFLAWSGPLSHQVAQLLHSWLPACVEGVVPFISSKNIPAGGKWHEHIIKNVKESDLTIFCMTRENRAANWPNFEAGASAVASEVVPLRINCLIDEIPSNLSHFQSTSFDEAGIWNLLEKLESVGASKGLHSKLDGDFKTQFHSMWWPALERGYFDHLKPAWICPFETEIILSDLSKRFPNSTGVVVIYNIEFSTLQKPGFLKFWKGLLSAPSFREIHFILPPKSFRRLERVLGTGAPVAKLFQDAGEKILIWPTPIPNPFPEASFHCFIGEGPRKEVACYYFPKHLPFARIASINGDIVWEQEHFFVIDNPELLKSLVDSYKHAKTESEGFTISDLANFNNGEKQDLSEIFASHFGSSKSKCHTQASEMERWYNWDAEGEVTISDDSPRITVKRRRGDIELWIKNPSIKERDPSLKDALLWIPPWGKATWRGIVRPLDEALRESYRIFHLKFAHPYKTYSFSMVEHDIKDALKALDMHAEKLGLAITSKIGNLAIVGVSVSAYLAIEAAARLAAASDSYTFRNLQIKSLSLLSPAVDLFDAIDVFRSKGLPNVELYTRRLYSARRPFLGRDIAEEVNLEPKRLGYFRDDGGHTVHLLDLPFRGASRCNSTHFVENLRVLLQKDVPVFIGHSPRDQMIKFEDVLSATSLAGADPANIMHEFPWWHDFALEQFCPPTEVGARDLPGVNVNGLVKFLSKSNQEGEDSEG